MIGVWGWRGPSRQSPGATPRSRGRSRNRSVKSPAGGISTLGGEWSEKNPVRRDRKVEPTGAFRSSRRDAGDGIEIGATDEVRIEGHERTEALVFDMAL